MQRSRIDRSLPVLVIALVALLGGLLAPAVAPAGVRAATASPKIVVIVGPVGSLTDEYRADGDAIAAAAASYTSNVIKLYSPNATWDVVKPALQGASVVVYIGHGNGFPSPYSTTLQPAKQDGLGLNPVAGGGDTTTQYWGESYLASDVRLAPGAVVFLHHLCYASGNGEPGAPEPTLDVAQQRIDNMGAGWIAAGARAVVADAYFGSDYYVRSLFTTHQTIDAVWRGAPVVHGNYAQFPSLRNPGLTGELDPVTPTSGFYRSLVGDPTLTSDAILAGGGSVTGDPAGGGGAGLGAPPTPPPASAPPPDATPPTLSVAPVSATSTTFSPNGDGSADTISLGATIEESARIEVTVAPPAGGPPVRSWSLLLPPGRASISWDGRSDAGIVVPDGGYVVTLVARDLAGNASVPYARTVFVYTALSSVQSAPSAIWPTDPNATAPGAAHLSFSLAAPATVTWTILDAAGATVLTHLDRSPLGAGVYAFDWDGRNAAGVPVAAGSYRSSVVATSGGLRIRTNAALSLGAFAVQTSAATVVRGTWLTVTARPIEPLRGAPLLRILQPGLAPRVVRMTALGSDYRLRTWIPAGGRAGLITLVVAGYDLGGVPAVVRVTRPLR